ncbi:Serine/threonine-protein kinase [Rhynchospora pubera]|uniref:Receptor-like serine/threonine-protein kinase n=1 Tax=Rhynchospora pubera TaxID=906938 RepID=A0AAV8H9G7_9POAL|nr:Serine/threonine-protein kinase [Rhynchospora pubera]
MSFTFFSFHQHLQPQTIFGAMKKWPPLRPLPPLLLTFFSLFSFSTCRDTITINSSLAAQETLVSSDGVFTLGFFSAGKYQYLGIWYTEIPQQTTVWVANRDSPITDTSGVLSISSNGSNLQLQPSSNSVLWSTSISANLVNPVAQLLDTGNFVLKENNTDSIAWQSFDHPTDTVLPGMKIGFITGQYRNLVSWSGSDDPSSSNYSFKLELSGFPEFFLLDGLKRVYRNGPWNGVHFSGEPEMENNGTFTFEYVSNENETYYTYYVNDPSIVSRLVVNQSTLQRYVADTSGSSWTLYWTFPRDQCDNYDQCGPNALCSTYSSNIPDCTCLTGFQPESEKDWELRDTSAGCVRQVELNCTTDGFIIISNTKLPDTTNVTVDTTIGLEECRNRCLMNCSCTGYANSDISDGGSGCVIWVGDLVDIRQFSAGGQDFYYRVAGSEVPVTSSTSTKKNKDAGIIVTCVILGLLILASIVYLIRKKLRKNHENVSYMQRQRQISFESVRPLASARDKDLEEGTSTHGNDINLPLFHASIISAATNNFAMANKLGEGGFGTVFKGELEGEERVAVKRLAKFSTQGLDEFKNEVILIAKLQHVNLVRLLGCCIEGEERMLVYEYMENKSLDTIIFNKARSSQLNWHKRFEIIKGIARGVLYLHEDSRFRIIHRDLKTSNVLLDENMNPKISDFGVARIFDGDEKKSYTNRVVGTYGYMSPEYAMDGVFSVKSDVFSFGVLILEIISGKKNRGIFSVEPLLNLLSYAWTLWKEGKPLELLDSSIPSNSNDNLQIMRCIQVGLLCVQDRPDDRPHMSEVVLMLNSLNASLPEPKQPGYFADRVASDMESSSSCTVFDTTVTVVEPR